MTKSFNQNLCCLTDIKLRWLYCYFGHFLVKCFTQILKYLKHDIDNKTLNYFIYYCHRCQNMESRLVYSDLFYIMILISTIQLWLILYTSMAHPFCILLIKEHNFKPVDGYKTLALNIYKIYYKHTRLIYI